MPDRRGRVVTLAEITDANWRAVADVVPHDDQRTAVAPSAARYLLLSWREGVWHSLAVLADDVVVGHVMWGYDDQDGGHWVGGLLIDAAEQGRGVGRAAMVLLLRHLGRRPDCTTVRLSYQPTNTAAAHLYRELGFAAPVRSDGGDSDGGGDDDCDEVVVELSAERAAHC